MNVPSASPARWALVAAGVFGLAGCGWFSAPDPVAPTTPCPLHMVHLPAIGDTGAVCIDLYEFPNRKGVLPRTHVTWTEAAAICANQDKRLCTAAEWSRACSGPSVRGVSARMYSYGASFDRQRCNTPRDDSGPPLDRPAPLAESGSFPDCHSPEGVFDLNGNVSEWVADEWTERAGPLMRSKDEPDAAGPAHVVRGGTMWTRTPYGQSCTSSHGHAGDSRFNDDGFRCCAEPRTPSGTPLPPGSDRGL